MKEIAEVAVPDERYQPEQVRPRVWANPLLDAVLKLRRGPDGVECDPTDVMCSENGNLHHGILSIIGVEAAWQTLGSDHAVACNVLYSPLRAGKVHKGTILGIGKTIKVGSQVMTCEANVYQGDDLLCRVMVQFVHHPGVPKPSRYSTHD